MPFFAVIPAQAGTQPFLVVLFVAKAGFQLSLE
jgi:hypothetical protein